MKKRISFTLLLICLCGLLHAQTLSFPGAEGFGAVATGGRGGNVYIVTNLNDAGQGSFRDAVSQPNRIVVFAVGGVINISSGITVRENITIAGQTAPGEGIAIYGNQITFRNNVICRYIRFHGSINMSSSAYTLQASGVDKGIFDHVSVLWGRWDNMKLDGSSNNITFQYCLVGEAILPQKLGSLFETAKNVTVHHSLWLNNKSRNPKAKAYIEYINNVVYNWGSDAFVCGHSSANHYQDIINNFFLAGPESSTNGAITQSASTDHVYQSGNFLAPNKNGTLNGRFLTNSDVHGSATIMSQPYFTAPNTVPVARVTIDPADVAFHKVVAKAGASKRRDAVDIRLINQVKSYGTEGKLITREGDVGGQPPMEGGIPLKDSNNTGIPDWWAEAMGFGATATSEWSKTMRTDGYTQLEHYINSIITAGMPETEITGITVASGAVGDDPFTGGCVTATQNINICGTTASGETVAVSRVDIGEIGTAIADVSGIWTYDYTDTELSERYYAFTACVKREDNTRSHSSAAYAVHIKTSPSESPQIFRMTVSPEKKFAGIAEPYSTVNVYIKDQPAVIATGTADGYGNWEATTTETFQPQQYAFEASAIDLAGLTTQPSTPFNVEMSIPVPVFTNITPDTGVSDSDQITSSQNLSFNGVAQPNGNITVYYLFNDGVTATVAGSVTAGDDGNWTLNYTGVTLAEGKYTFLATTNVGGMPSPMSAPFMVTIDRTRPAVAGSRRHDPETANTAASTLVYRVTFAEQVLGVTRDNFTVTRSGSNMTGNVTGFSQIDDYVYEITVTDAAGDGTIRVDLRANQTNIVDIAGNQCTAAYTGGQTYTMRYVGSGVWMTNQDGLWTDPDMWEDEIMADGVGATADFSTVDIEEAVVVTLDANVTLGRMIFTDADEESPGAWHIVADHPDLAITLANPNNTVPEIKANYDNDDSGLDYNKSKAGKDYPTVIDAPVKSGNGLRKTGWGTLQFNNVCNISGPITVAQGYLKLGAGSELNISATLEMNQAAGTGLLVAGGSFSTTADVNLNFSSESMIEVSGGRADFKKINPSNNRNGIIRVSGGVMTADEIMIQRNSDSSISWSSGFLVTGGSATIGVLGLGTNDSWGTATVSGGTLAITDAVYVGYQNTGGRGGGMRVQGGELIVSGNNGIVLSRRHSRGNANNVASLEITGGNVTAKRIALGYDSQVTAGSATLTLNNSNSFLYLGSLGLVKNGSFTTNVNLNNGTLGADENWSTTVPMNLGGVITIKAANAANDARNITIGGVLSGTGGFNKTGEGRLTLNAAHTYSGATTVSAGTLHIESGSVRSNISVLTGAVLAGGGTASGTVNAASGATIHPGAASATTPVTLNINNLTVNSSILRFNLFSNNAGDRINLTGTLTKNGANNTIDVNTLEPGIYNLGKLAQLSDATVTLNGQPVVDSQSAVALYECNGDLYLAIGSSVFNAQIPNITLHPQGANVNVGVPVNLSVTANVTDFGQLTYQWYSNASNSNNGGMLINGATSANYSPVTSTEGTTYYYVVVANTNNCISGMKTVTIASNTAAVTFMSLINAQTPDISEHPQDTNVYAGGPLNLSVTANVTDNGHLSYQWYRNTVNSNSDGTLINGATSADYSPATTIAGTTYYYVTVTNTNNAVNGVKTATATSNAAMVTVIVNAQAPNISVHPAGADVYVAAPVNLSVTANVTDGGILSYQWYSNVSGSNSDGTPLNGATNANYSPATATTGTTYYYVVVTNTNNGVNGEKTAATASNTAKVTITVAPAVVSVTVSSASSAVKKGETLQFTADVTVIGDATKEVTWSVTDNRYSTTVINENGLLTVAAGETAGAVTVTATSVFDKTKYGSATVTIGNINITAVGEFSAVDLNVYPNPFTGTVHLTGAAGCLLRVVNAAGAVIHVQKIESPDEMLRLEHLPAGVYIFCMEKEGNVKTISVAKE